MKTNLNKMSVLILAAGQGKRMKSDLPKVLQPLAGKPLLRHVVDTARSLNADTIHVVYGHGGEQVRAAFANDALHWALQAEQKGTGHAVMQAMPQVPDDHLVLVLYGDVPLINLQTLQQLIALARPHTMSLLTVMLDDPTGLQFATGKSAGSSSGWRRCRPIATRACCAGARRRSISAIAC